MLKVNNVLSMQGAWSLCKLFSHFSITHSVHMNRDCRYMGNEPPLSAAASRMVGDVLDHYILHNRAMSIMVNHYALERSTLGFR